MKKTLTLLLIIALLTLNLTSAHAEETKKLTVEWQLFPPGIRGISIVEASDGGFLALGENVTAHVDDTTHQVTYSNITYVLVKISGEGKIEWTKTLTEPYSLNSIIKTSDGGYALAGLKMVPVSWLSWVYNYNFSNPKGTNPELFLLKIDSSGNTQWSKTFENFDYKYYNYGEVGQYLIQTIDDDGFTIIGTFLYQYDRNSGCLFVKTDSSGNLLLNKTINYDPVTIILNDDGSYMVICYVYARGVGSALTSLKIDKEGNIQWSKDYPLGLTDQPFCDQAIAMKDGGYLIAGSRSTNYENGSGWLTKIDSSGNPVWSKQYDTGRINSIAQSVDVGYFFATVTGENESYGGKTMIAKVNDKGDIKGSIEIDPYPLHGTNQPEKIIATSDGGCILVGTADDTSASISKFWIVKFGPLPYNQDEDNQTPEPFNFLEQSPYITIGAVVLVIAALTGTCLIVYFKKRKHSIEQLK